jgi:ABC-2 type transport system permease protein
MKIIWRIAKVELRTLFYSPVAWLVLFVFAYQAGFAVTSTFQLLIRFIASGGIGEGEGATSYFNNFFKELLSRLNFYIPLLTMGLMSRETSSGSIKLLYSSPVKIVQIVLGKYLSILVYSGVLIVILCLFFFSSAFFIVSPDYGLLLSSLCGTFLTICLYAAIGLLMSSMTIYQPIAAISTLITIAFLQHIGDLGQSIDLIRNVSYYLSLSSRYENFTEGLISSKNFFYFLFMTMLFLGLTIFIMTIKKQSTPLKILIIRFCFFVSVLFLGIYLTSKPANIGYYDGTAVKRKTLSAVSQQLVSQIKYPLRVHTFVNLLDFNSEPGYSDSRYIHRDIFEPFQRLLKDEIQFDYTYYYDSIENAGLYDLYPKLSSKEVARKVADSRGINFEKVLAPEELRKTVNIDPEGKTIVSQLEIGDKKTFLRFFQDYAIYPFEFEISSALEHMVGHPVKIGFTTGHNERSITKSGSKDYTFQINTGANREALINRGFDLKEIDLSTENIPDSMNAVVIAAPRLAFSAAEKEKLDRYVEEGGNLIVLGDLGSQKVLNTLTENIGVRFSEDTLYQFHRKNPVDFIIGNLTQTGAGYSNMCKRLWKDSAAFTFPGASLIEYKKAGTALFVADSIIVAPHSWSSNSGNTDDRNQQTYPVVIRLSRTVSGRRQLIIVASDADFITDGLVDRTTVASMNNYLFPELFRSMGDTTFHLGIGMGRPKSKDVNLLIGHDQLTFIRTVCLFVLPGILLLTGTVILIIRKNK